MDLNPSILKITDTDMFKEPLEDEDFAFTGFGEAECGIPV